MINWKQLSKKGVRWPASHEVHNSVRSCIFLKVIHWPVFGFQLIVNQGPYFIVEFTLLSKCKSWITWERHFSLNDTTRALLWALAKFILYHYYISNWFWKCIMLVCIEQTSMPALEGQLANSDFKNRNDCFAVQKSHKFVGNMLHIQWLDNRCKQSSPDSNK